MTESNVRYKVVITKIRDVTTVRKGEYCQIGDKEVERERKWLTDEQGNMINEPRTRIAADYGYAPERECTVTEEVNMLSQVVEGLDFAAVIKAVNGL